MQVSSLLKASWDKGLGSCGRGLEFVKHVWRGWWEGSQGVWCRVARTGEENSAGARSSCCIRSWEAAGLSSRTRQRPQKVLWWPDALGKLFRTEIQDCDQAAVTFSMQIFSLVSDSLLFQILSCFRFRRFYHDQMPLMSLYISDRADSQSLLTMSNFDQSDFTFAVQKFLSLGEYSRDLAISNVC